MSAKKIKVDGRFSGDGVQSESFPCRVVDVRAAASGDDINVVEGIAQVYGQVNDRCEIFTQGAFRKTIQERVPALRVKITDGHIWTAKDTHGVVIEAEERADGLYFRAKWSSTAGSQEIKTKMVERIVDELSIEFRAINDEYKTVDGCTIRVVNEAVWNGLAILPYSSQGDAALISVRGALPYQDLPIAPIETVWSKKEARARIMERSGGANINWAQLRKAFLREDKRGVPESLSMQVADVVDGRVVVVPQALFRVAKKLLDPKNMDVQQLITARSHVESYFQKMNKQNGTSYAAPWTYSSVDSIVADARYGCAGESRGKEALEVVETLLPVLNEEQKVSLRSMLDAGPAEPPTEASSNSVVEGSALDLAEMRNALRTLEIELLNGSLK